MNSPLPHSIASFKPARSTTLLYEDLGTVEPGLAFALHLGTELGLDVGCPEYHGWLHMLGLPEKSAELLRGAQASSYLVLSLRGDTEFSAAHADWLGQWSASATPGKSALIVLFDPLHSDTHRAAALRDQLEAIVAEHGIDAFFYDADSGESQAETHDTYHPDFHEAEDPLEAAFIGSVYCFSDANERLLGVA